MSKQDASLAGTSEDGRCDTAWAEGYERGVEAERNAIVKWLCNVGLTAASADLAGMILNAQHLADSYASWEDENVYGE